MSEQQFGHVLLHHHPMLPRPRQSAMRPERACLDHYRSEPPLGCGTARTDPPDWLRAIVARFAWITHVQNINPNFAP